MRVSSFMRWFPAACLLCAGAGAAAAAFEEYQVKAVYLFNFARFVDWPADATGDPARPMTICTVGPDPFGTYLQDAVRDEQVGGHELVLREVPQGDSLQGCNIAFVSRPEAPNLDAILRDAAARHVLTVSDIPDFIHRGGAIGFETRENHVRIQVNTQAARAAGLTISSKLLRIASVVAPP